MAQTLVRNLSSPLRYSSMRNMMGENVYANDTTGATDVG
jgi:hypothetical protein